MSSYVEQYLSLEQKANDEDQQAERYRSRAEGDRWRQCQVAYEAIDSGKYSRRSFAEDVGRNDRHIGVQYRMWESWGRRDISARPSYRDAYAEASGTTAVDQQRTSDVAVARRMMRNPETARRVLSEPEVQQALMSDDHIRAGLTHASHEVDVQRATRVDRHTRQAHPGLAEAREYLEVLSRLTHARQDTHKALDLLRSMPPLDAEERADVRQELDWLSSTIDWLREMTKARRAASLADEVEAFLAEVES